MFGRKHDILSLAQGLGISRGRILGARMYAIPGRKDSISGTSTLLDDVSQIPSTLILPSPGGVQLELLSSSGNDLAATGTGARQVAVVYLDTSGTMQCEIVNMNGVTPVTTVATDIDKVQWMHTSTVGGLEVAAGNISLRAVGGGTTFEYIAAGGNQSLSCRFHIPTGTTGYILGWQVSGIVKKIDFRLRATVSRFDRTLTAGAYLFQDAVVVNDSLSGWIPFSVPLKCPATAGIKVSAVSVAVGGDAGAEFDVLIVDD